MTELFKHGASRSWWDAMNDPDHPARRKKAVRNDADHANDQMFCGPLGGAMAMYWYYIGCPGTGCKRPLTPVFNN